MCLLAALGKQSKQGNIQNKKILKLGYNAKCMTLFMLPQVHAV